MIVPFACVHGLSGIGECSHSLIQGHRVKTEQASELSVYQIVISYYMILEGVFGTGFLQTFSV